MQKISHRNLWKYFIFFIFKHLYFENGKQLFESFQNKSLIFTNQQIFIFCSINFQQSLGLFHNKKKKKRFLSDFIFFILHCKK